MEHDQRRSNPCQCVDNELCENLGGNTIIIAIIPASLYVLFSIMTSVHPDMPLYRRAVAALVLHSLLDLWLGQGEGVLCQCPWRWLVCSQLGEKWLIHLALVLASLRGDGHLGEQWLNYLALLDASLCQVLQWVKWALLTQPKLDTMERSLMATSAIK